MVLVCVAVHGGEGRIGRTYNVLRFGALPDGKTDFSQALLSAWGLACKDYGSTVVIPKQRGAFFLNPVTLNGPCAGPITLLVNGVVRAPEKSFLTDGGPPDYWVLFNHLRQLTVTGSGTFDGQGAFAWSVNPCKTQKYCIPFPANIKFNDVSNGVIEGISSINSKFFHIIIDNSEDIEITGVTIYAPEHSLNTDGIHIERSSGVRAHNLAISTGDDCISFGQGSNDIEVYDVRCGPGHGISIGSLGKYEEEEDVRGILVRNSTLTDTTNGVRIKTWAPSPPSKLFNVTFRDIILNRVSNPIVVDQHYCPNNECQHKGESQVGISRVKFINIVGTTGEEVSVKIDCSKDKPCEDVELVRLDITTQNNKPTLATCSSYGGYFLRCLSPTHCT
ncbi:hypothetical protein DM860_007871 [Cuscuta australis]|uniref:Pectate lyase superfamily protein domain-containing protein n=1 Tax=Cuscuta australis TaxID=267555 RepID=A0A328DWT3_9ASTE|nr:hypothetical protein DM860_007871 [Cuscuta australis]